MIEMTAARNRQPHQTVSCELPKQMSEIWKGVGRMVGTRQQNPKMQLYSQAENVLRARIDRWRCLRFSVHHLLINTNSKIRFCQLHFFISRKIFNIFDFCFSSFVSKQGYIYWDIVNLNYFARIVIIYLLINKKINIVIHMSMTLSINVNIGVYSEQRPL